MCVVVREIVCERESVCERERERKRETKERYGKRVRETERVGKTKCERVNMGSMVINCTTHKVFCPEFFWAFLKTYT